MAYAGYNAMTYIPLSIKYRPETFNDIVGQQTIINTLKRSLISKRITYAYLFSGNHGIGKTTIARILAKNITCQNNINAQACNKCKSCINISNSKALDIIEIDGASNTSIDDIRLIKDNIKYAPNYTKFKIFIIDEVHMLSINAFNALLKMLEEPPKYIKFIFATTAIHKIPLTVISRCQHYHFKQINFKHIKHQLYKISKQEGINISNNGLSNISLASHGSMRNAINFLDQIISFSGKHPSIQNILQILGLSSDIYIKHLLYSLITRNIKKTLLIFHNIYMNGIDIISLLERISIKIRNLYVKFYINNYKVSHTTYNLKDLLYILTTTINTINAIMTSNNQKLIFELYIFKIIDRPKIYNIIDIKNAITRIELLTHKTSYNHNSKENYISIKSILIKLKNDICKQNNIKYKLNNLKPYFNKNKYTNTFLEKIIKIFSNDINNLQAFKNNENN